MGALSDRAQHSTAQGTVHERLYKHILSGSSYEKAVSASLRTLFGNLARPFRRF